ncbi:MAG: SDR family oxidoreductase [Clostridia bacterium]|nr:SDR family oxidoreductase [Clostridia bacterium]
MKKVVLITGASKGIGSAIAKRFATGEYIVVINYNKSEAPALSLSNEIIATGGTAMCCKADVSNATDVKNMISEIINKFSTVDILINNAGISYEGLLSDTSDEIWNNIIATNLTGVFNCTKAVLPYMINQKKGKIINISSIWGICGASCEVAYSASKSGVIGFSKALAKEVGPSGVNVNCIAPGIIDTDMNNNLTEQDKKDFVEELPISRIGNAKDIADTAFFLCSESADYITGQVLAVDGGYSI